MVQEREERFAVFDEIRARNSGVAPEEAETDAAREVAARRRERKGRAEKG